MDSNRFRQAMAATITGFDASLRQDMPASPYRDFQLWAMRSAAKDTWWQILGIPQFAKLTTLLLSDLVESDDDWERLLGYATTMNRYLIYEAMSDNFANYLQTEALTHPLRPFQIHAVSRLNDTIITRLENDNVSTSDLLGSAKPAVGKLSLFANSITRDEQTAFAQRFIEERAEVALHSLEFGGWGLLVANAETCVQVGHVLDGTRLEGLLKQGLAWRYQAVNRLLYSLDMSLPELVDAGTQSVLVIPYLTYYIGVINEIIAPNERLSSIIENGLLEKALYRAALLVRVANDVGTELLMSDEHHGLLIEQIADHPNEQSSINNALLDLSNALPLLTRFEKDIRFGEYNVCLYDVGTSRNTAGARARLERNLSTLGRIYRQNRAQLLVELDEINGLMGSEITSTLIRRFVEFHERLYSYTFKSQAGEYATTPNA